jgi:hypothetical protein
VCYNGTWKYECHPGKNRNQEKHLIENRRKININGMRIISRGEMSIKRAG